MGFMDKAKDAMEGAKDKAQDLAREHGDKIEQGLDKASDFIQSKTPDSIDDKVQATTDKAKGLVDKLEGDDDAT